MSGDPYDDISRRYEAELRAVIPVLRRWWDGIAGRDIGGTTREERWPMGPCSHPRYVEIFRRYFLEIVAENERSDAAPPAAPAPDPDAEEMWGRDAEPDGANRGPVNPSEILLTEMILKDQELKRFLGLFVFIPVGSDEGGSGDET